MSDADEPSLNQPRHGPRQSRAMSLVESFTNVVVGFGLAVLTQMLVFPGFGLRVSVGDNFVIGAVFTLVSIVRSYMLRRLFEATRIRPLKPGAAARWGSGLRGWRSRQSTIR